MRSNIAPTNLFHSPSPCPHFSNVLLFRTAMPVHESRTHVALLASPGMGHLIPVLELAKRLSLHHGLETSLVVVGAGSSAAESLTLQKASTIRSLNIVPLPPVDLDGRLEPNASVVDKIKAMMRESFKDLRSAITAMKPRPAALIVDLFGIEALAMARELGLLSYVFMTTNAWYLSLALFFPGIERQCIEDHAYRHEPLKIPGCRPVRFEDTTELFRINQQEVYEEFARYSREVGTADGILCNTWQDLEATSLKALSEAGILTSRKVNEVQIYPIGPLTRGAEPGLKSEVLDWLENQPRESVIFVSFGSGGTLSAEQITELAWGLELSQQRFVWVVRPPVKNDAAGSFFTVGNRPNGSPDYVPEGFTQRTKKMGLVVPMWAPQAEILSHPSVGGFLTHCGWNSTIESIVNGVPMIAWPLYAEQGMNATMLTEELEVGVRLRVSASKRVVMREQIEKMVRKIMEKEDKEGKAIRERVKELKNSGEKARCKGGSSYNSLSQVARECEIFRRRAK